jgi:hypothetical protein
MAALLIDANAPEDAKTRPAPTKYSWKADNVRQHPDVNVQGEPYGQGSATQQSRKEEAQAAEAGAGRPWDTSTLEEVNQA